MDDFVLSALSSNTVNGLLALHGRHQPGGPSDQVCAHALLSPRTSRPSSFSRMTSASARRAFIRRAAPSRAAPTAPPVGTRNWTVTQGSVTVISNAFVRFGRSPIRWRWPPARCSASSRPPPATVTSSAYNLRGPCAVGWWDGSVDPLSRRAQDLISGNNGAFFYGATNVAPGFVGGQGFFFLANRRQR